MSNYCSTHKYILLSIFLILRWQARREQDRNMRAGLIPSRALQERRIVHERNELNGESESDKGGMYKYILCM